MEKISAVITMYNSEKFIIDTMKSLLNQSDKFDEIVIIDDKSVDESKKIVSEMAKKDDSIKLFFLEKNLGPSAARNFAIDKVKNRWILFVDHDDILDKNLVKNYRKIISVKKYSDVSFVFPSFVQIDNEGVSISDKISYYKELCTDFTGDLFIRNPILSTTGVLINKEKLVQVNGFDDDLKYSQDWDLWLKLSMIGEIIFDKNTEVFIRRHNNNTSREISGFLKDEQSVYNKYDIEFIFDKIMIREKDEYENYIDFVTVLMKLNKLDNAYDILQKVRVEDYRKYFLQGIILYKNNDIKDAEMKFKKALELNPQDIASLNNIGCCKSLMLQYDEARRYFEKALDLNRSYMDASYNISNIDEPKITERILRKILTRYSANR